MADEKGLSVSLFGVGWGFGGSPPEPNPLSRSPQTTPQPPPPAGQPGVRLPRAGQSWLRQNARPLNSYACRESRGAWRLERVQRHLETCQAASKRAVGRDAASKCPVSPVSTKALRLAPCRARRSGPNLIWYAHQGYTYTPTRPRSRLRVSRASARCALFLVSCAACKRRVAPKPRARRVRQKATHRRRCSP